MAEVRRRAGVHLDRVEGNRVGTYQDAALHLDVHLLRRAYLFTARISDHAASTGSLITTVLGMVMAHEIGHMLLPEHSHAPSGLMQAQTRGRIDLVPGFASAQRVVLHRTLAADLVARERELGFTVPSCRCRRS